MRYPPPAPLDSFLRTPIPVLEELSVDDSAAKLSGVLREQELMSRADSASSKWLCQMAGLQRNRGRIFAALAYADQALEVANREFDPLDITSACAVKASVQTIQGNYVSARQTLTAIPPVAIGKDSDAILAIYEESLGKLLLRAVGVESFEFNEATERYQRSLSLYEDLDDIPGQIRCLIGLSSVSSGDGRYFRALEYVDEGLELCAEFDDWRYLNQLIGCAAFAFRDQGYHQHVADLFQLSIDWSTFIGDRPQKIRSAIGLGEFYRMVFSPPRTTEFDKSLEILRKSVDEAQDCSMGPLMLQGQMALADLFHKAGDFDSQRKCRDLAEKWAKAEPFEGAIRVMDWNDLIGAALVVSRERRMASHLEEAIEGSADPFFVFDEREGSDPSHGDFINEFRNSAANNLLNINSTDIRLLSDLSEVAAFQGLRDVVIQVANKRSTFEDEISIVKENGEITWYARRVSPAGNGAVVTLRDISSNRKIEDALRNAADRAKEADRAKSEFLANMSHEVRTPINGVLGLAQLLGELDLDPTARKYVDGIASSGAILLKVIGDVLDLSKIEARKMHLDPQPTPLVPLLQDVIGLFEGKAAQGGIDLTLKIDPEVPDVIVVDGTGLRQVLANLVGNALKFTPAGAVHLSVVCENSQLMFRVTDSGVGVPPHLIDLIFEPFQRAVSESDGIDGTGLGLTISRRLIELMGGKISVVSKEGEGSTFYFSLPLTVGCVSEHEGVANLQPDEIRFDGFKVLLVEDNEVNVLVSEGMLEQLGCEITHAENGQVALECVRAAYFDLVLMDVRMPIMDGLAATRAIREMEGGTDKHVPIIALTAGALAQEKVACFDAGMDDYLVKPFSKTSLRDAMSRQFGPAGTRKQTI